jgi:hypothetical protein
MSISNRRRIALVQVVLIVAAGSSAANAGKIYWSEITYTTAALQRSNLDGSNIQDVSDGPTNGIAIDPVARHLYWGSTASGAGPSLRRANLDGSNMVILHDLDFGPGPLALDPETGWIFTGANIGDGCDGIWRFRANGVGDGERVVSNSCPGGLAVETETGKLYWTERSFPGRIRRAHLDGSFVQTLIDLEATPWGLALDPTRGKIYWTEEYSPNVVLRADMDGQNIEVLVPGESGSRGIALDLQSDQLYYTLGEWPNEIYRSELDGSNPQRILSVNAHEQIALDPVADDGDVPAVSSRGIAGLVLAMLVVSSVMLRRRRRVRLAARPPDTTG